MVVVLDSEYWCWTSRSLDRWHGKIGIIGGKTKLYKKSTSKMQSKADQHCLGGDGNDGTICSKFLYPLHPLHSNRLRATASSFPQGSIPDSTFVIEQKAPQSLAKPSKLTEP